MLSEIGHTQKINHMVSFIFAWAFQVALVVKNHLPMQETRAMGIPGSGRSPGERNGNPFQYPCLENSTDRGGWWATVQRVAKCQTLLSG